MRETENTIELEEVTLLPQYLENIESHKISSND